jgi:hypothetical protein
MISGLNNEKNFARFENGRAAYLYVFNRHYPLHFDIKFFSLRHPPVTPTLQLKYFNERRPRASRTQI